MSLMTEQHISAQVWDCDICGGHDPKSCGCAGATATSREIKDKVERLAAKQEQDRQRSKAYRERQTASRDAPVENIEEIPQPPLARAKAVLAENPGASAYKLKKLSGANIAMCRRAIREEKPKQHGRKAGLEAADKRDAFLIRADAAGGYAFYEGPIDDEIIAAADEASILWQNLSRALKEGRHVSRETLGESNRSVTVTKAVEN